MKLLHAKTLLVSNKENRKETKMLSLFESIVDPLKKRF